MNGNTRNQMRKMAVTGLMLVSLTLGGMGLMGCDQLETGQVGAALGSAGVSLMPMADFNLPADKTVVSSKPIGVPPPRR